MADNVYIRLNSLGAELERLQKSYVFMKEIVETSEWEKKQKKEVEESWKLNKR